MNTKHCSGCKTDKPTDQFSKNVRMKDGLQSWCNQCLKNHRDNIKNDPKFKEKEKKRQAKWYAENRERRIEVRKVYEHNRWANDQEYRKKKNDLKKSRREIRVVSEPGYLEKLRLWGRSLRQRRRARDSGLPHDLTKEQWNEILERFNHACAYCGKTGVNLEQEHKIPSVKGGGYTASNIVPACHRCNMRKHAMTDTEFREYLKKHPD